VSSVSGKKKGGEKKVEGIQGQNLCEKASTGHQQQESWERAKAWEGRVKELWEQIEWWAKGNSGDIAWSKEGAKIGLGREGRGNDRKRKEKGKNRYEH